MRQLSLCFCLTGIAHEFHQTDRAIALSITLTLAFRPVGALIFGFLADRFGRRGPLMLALVFYSVIELFSGLAPNYVTFLTKWATSSRWECSFKRITEKQGVVFLELEERSAVETTQLELTL